MAQRVPGKKETLLAYLARGIAMVHLDARRPAVVVP
ncbi:MAG: stringent starvation protein B, partial [Deltaproteobacteria bacterium]